MNKMDFTFSYSTDVDTIYVSSEKCNIYVEGLDKSNLEGDKHSEIEIVGHFEMNEPVNYAWSDENIVTLDESDKHIRIDTSEIESDLHEKSVDYGSSMILVRCPKNKEIRVESELGRIRLKNIDGKIVVDTEVGSISLKNVKGEINLDSEVGNVSVQDVESNYLKCHTEVGNIRIDRITANDVSCNTEIGQIIIVEADVLESNLSSETGNIEYKLLPTIKQCHSKISSEIGKVKIVIPHDLTLEVSATSEMGVVSSFLKNIDNTEIEDGVRLITTGIPAGTAKCTIEIETEIGSVSLLNEDTDEKSDTLNNFKNGKLSKEIDKAMKEVNKVTKVLSSPGFRKVMGGAFSNLGDTIRTSIQSALKDTDVTIKESVKDMKSNFQKESEIIKQQAENMKAQAEDMKKDNEMVRKIVRKKRVNDGNTRHGISENERSRLKVLELLGDGKITQQNAEQLLKAIGK